MAETRTYAPGTPSWVDLSTTDMEAAKKFYGTLFGWEAADLGPDAGGYMFFKNQGKDVAGVGPVQQAGQPSAWMVYFDTDDADAVATKIEEAGGKVVAPAFDVLDAGRMAMFQDPIGTFFSVWQPMRMGGAQITNEPNSFAWAELNARGVDSAKPFYMQVFGWGDKTSPMGEGRPPYTEWQVQGNTVAGAMEMASMVPPQVPNHWLIYFAVPDVDAATARVGQLGGQTQSPPMDFPGGRFSIVQDPQGAVFGLMKMEQRS